jgi:hypothetical protein
MLHVWRTGVVYIGYWWVSLGKGNCLEDPGVEGKIILNWISSQHPTNKMHSVIP